MPSVCMIGNFVSFSGALEVYRMAAKHIGHGWKATYLYHMASKEETRPDLSMFDRVEYVDETIHDRETLGMTIAAIVNQHDICHTSLVPMQWRYCLKRCVKRPIVETYHSIAGWNNCWSQYKQRLAGGIEQPADATVAVSMGLANRIAADTGFQVDCVYNGVEVPEQKAQGQYVTYCGRIANGKGLDEWLSIALAVRDALPGAKFQWVGSSTYGGEPWLMECLKKACPWLDIVGFIEDPAPYYQRSACLLMTSGAEGLPMSILEAMAHGVPAVAYPAGDTAESGCIIARDASDATAKVLDVLNNPSLATLAPHFHAPVMAESYRKIYEAIRA